MPADARALPRVVGAVWLLYFLTSAVGALLTRDGPLSPDLGPAVGLIVDHASTYRAGVGVTLLSNGLYVVLSALLFALFAPVNRGVALAAAFLSLTGCVVQTVAQLLQLAPLALHGDPALQAMLSADQIRAAILLSLKVYRQGFTIAVSMFALFNLLLGYLILRGRFIPRVFGVFFLVAGGGWIFSLWPPLAVVFSYVGLPASGLAEVGTTLWLLFKGIDVTRWQDLTTTAARA
jgi:hypothetical protein